jgi:TatD DNase family protein
VPPLHDAHQHLHFESLAPHRSEILRDLAAAGVQHLVVNGTNEEEWPVVAALAREIPRVIPSFGVHPWDCGDRSPDWESRLRTALVANPGAHVGEIGMDRFIVDLKPDDPRIAGLRVAPLAEQVEVLATQLALAAELGRAASIHCVQAFGPLMDLLRKTKLPARGFLIHGYGGPAEMIPEFARLGAYFSFNIELLRARGAGRLENFRTITADRLLVETDAPTKPPPDDLNRYPLPLASDGSRVNHPANLVVAYEQLAVLRGIPLSELTTLVERNFQRLFL